MALSTFARGLNKKASSNKNEEMHEMDVGLNERGFGILPECKFIRFHMLLLVAVSRSESIQISGRDSTSSILMKIELPRAN